MQYDSWWYYKGDGAGVVLWEPMPSTLGGPDVNGDPSTWFKLPLPTITHCRFFQVSARKPTETPPCLIIYRLLLSSCAFP